MPLSDLDKQFWKRVNELAIENMKQPTYEYFIAPTRLISVKENQAEIIVASDFHKQFWRNQNDLITTASLETYGDILQYKLFSPSEIDSQQFSEIPTEAVVTDSDINLPYSYSSNLLKKYSFDNFVKGEQNRMTLAISMEVVNMPGKYNPLFIFGRPGLGKTHLLHAIGNEFLKKFPHKHVLYASSENFVTDYVNAARKNQMTTFVDKYRNLDLLLLDDVQFFSDKEGTINEFFSTFNVLRDKDAQMVITSDRPPDELNQLPERLTSRFTQGTTTNITVPDFETRMAILMNKAEETDLHFTDDTISYIAGQINSNVRELEGALNNIALEAKVDNLTTVDVKTAEKVLEKLKTTAVKTKRNNLTSTKIKDEVAKYYHLPVSELTGPKRQKEIAYARQIAMYLIRDMLGASLPAIGHDFGNRDHSTVIYATRVITEKMKNDNDTQRDIDNLRRKLE